MKTQNSFTTIDVEWGDGLKCEKDEGYKLKEKKQYCKDNTVCTTSQFFEIIT